MNDITAKNTRKINKKTIITVASALAVITILAAVFLIFILPTTKSDEDKYNDAKRALAAGDYNKAYTLFKETTYYADSAEYLEDFTLRFDKVIRNIDGKIHVVETAYDENGNLTDETEYDDEHFKKTVKVYDENGRRIKTYRVENDEWEEYTYTYDENGKVTESLYTDKDEITKYIYTYDESGNEISSVVNSNGKETVWETDYIYDENSNILKKSEHKNGLLVSTYEYAYKDGNKTKYVATTYDSVNQPTEVKSEEYVYNDNNELIKVVLTNEKSITTQEYSNGIITKESCYSISTGTTEISTYNSFGFPLTKTVKHNDGSEYLQEKYTYDEKGLELTCHIYTENGEISYHSETTYNDNGTTKTFYRNYHDYEFPSGINIIVTEYTYDDMGNMIGFIEKAWNDDETIEKALIEWVTIAYDSFGNTISFVKTSNHNDNYTITYEYHGIKAIYNPDTNNN